MGIDGAFISINIKSSERKSSMLEKSMGKSALMVALVTGNVIWGGTALYAEEGLQQFNLDQMVVTATRTMKELQEVPSSVSVVTSQDIEERNINSVPEALQTLPGVYMSQAAQGGIQIRGFSSSDILVFVPVTVAVAVLAFHQIPY